MKSLATRTLMASRWLLVVNSIMARGTFGTKAMDEVFETMLNSKANCLTDGMDSGITNWLTSLFPALQQRTLHLVPFLQRWSMEDGLADGPVGFLGFWELQWPMPVGPTLGSLPWTGSSQPSPWPEPHQEVGKGGIQLPVTKQEKNGGLCHLAGFAKSQTWKRNRRAR